MSLFRRQKRSGPKPVSPPQQSEPQAPKLVGPTGAPEHKAIKPAAPVSAPEPQAPKLVGSVGAPEPNRIKARVQAEVCAIMARTILALIRSSEAQGAANDELLTCQTVNRLYAEVLYDLLSDGAAPEIDPAERVQRWAREALEDWGRSQTALSPDLVREREVLVQSILDAMAAAARDDTLRTAAERRVAADQRLASEG